jgi:hypothetical protein
MAIEILVNHRFSIVANQPMNWVSATRGIRLVRMKLSSSEMLRVGESAMKFLDLSARTSFHKLVI